MTIEVRMVEFLTGIGMTVLLVLYLNAGGYYAFMIFPYRYGLGVRTIALLFWPIFFIVQSIVELFQRRDF